MSGAVLVAMSGRWEGAVVATIERSAELSVVRRCADLADLSAAAAAGVASLAVVSADLRSLDRSAVHELRRQAVGVIGVYPPADTVAQQRLRQLGIDPVLPADAALEDLEAAARSADPSACPDPVGDDAELAAFEASLRSGAVARPGRPGSVGGSSSAVVAQEPNSHRGRMVAVWGPTGAPGRTTLAVNLATELGSQGHFVVLVDADTYGGSVGQVLSLLDEAPGLAAAARAADHGRLDLAMLARLAPEVAPKVRVLTGLPKAERWPELRQGALELVLTLCRDLAAYTVVDCGFSLEDDEELSYDTAAPRRNVATLTALAACDTVLAVGAADPIGLQRLVRGLQELGSVRSPAPVVVVNKVRAGSVGKNPEQRIREALARFAGVDDPWFVPSDQDTLDAVLLAGRSLTEAAPQSLPRLAIARLAVELAAGRAPATAAATSARLSSRV